MNALDSTSTEPLLIAIVGPTGSGKTALAVRLAEQMGGEVVSCDSVAVYKEMDVGTAKPSAEERRRARHHLIDVLTPDEFCSAGDYSRLARAAIAEIAARGRVPIVAGGTGLYLRALLEGLFAGPQRSEELRERLRRSAERHGAAWLHRVLRRMDAGAAERIHENDVAKVIRAIEVCVTGRQPLTEAWQTGRDPLRGFRVRRIGLDPPREKLYERLNQRVREMFAAGLVEETRELLRKYGPVRPLESLGYRQAQAVVRGEMTEAEAVKATAQGHRNYAKRQMTWFRREPQVEWVREFGADVRYQSVQRTACGEQ